MIINKNYHSQMAFLEFNHCKKLMNLKNINRRKQVILRSYQKELKINYILQKKLNINQMKDLFHFKFR